MIAIPDILIDVIDFSGEKFKLKPGATPEQQKAFKKFVKEYEADGGCFHIEI
jgi:hypothetical protein